MSSPHLDNEAKAFEYIESIVWAAGVTCPHCDVISGRAYDPSGVSGTLASASRIVGLTSTPKKGLVRQPKRGSRWRTRLHRSNKVEELKDYQPSRFR